MTKYRLPTIAAALWLLTGAQAQVRAQERVERRSADYYSCQVERRVTKGGRDPVALSSEVVSPPVELLVSDVDAGKVTWPALPFKLEGRDSTLELAPDLTPGKNGEINVTAILGGKRMRLKPIADGGSHPDGEPLVSFASLLASVPLKGFSPPRAAAYVAVCDWKSGHYKREGTSWSAPKWSYRSIASEATKLPIPTQTPAAEACTNLVDTKSISIGDELLAAQQKEEQAKAKQLLCNALAKNLAGNATVRESKAPPEATERERNRCKPLEKSDPDSCVKLSKCEGQTLYEVSTSEGGRTFWVKSRPELGKASQRRGSTSTSSRDPIDDVPIEVLGPPDVTKRGAVGGRMFCCPLQPRRIPPGAGQWEVTEVKDPSGKVIKRLARGPFEYEASVDEATQSCNGLLRQRFEEMYRQELEVSRRQERESIAKEDLPPVSPASNDGKPVPSSIRAPRVQVKRATADLDAAFQRALGNIWNDKDAWYPRDLIEAAVAEQGTSTDPRAQVMGFDAIVAGKPQIDSSWPKLGQGVVSGGQGARSYKINLAPGGCFPMAVTYTGLHSMARIAAVAAGRVPDGLRVDTVSPEDARLLNHSYGLSDAFSLGLSQADPVISIFEWNECIRTGDTECSRKLVYDGQAAYDDGRWWGVVARSIAIGAATGGVGLTVGATVAGITAGGLTLTTEFTDKVNHGTPVGQALFEASLVAVPATVVPIAAGGTLANVAAQVGSRAGNMGVRVASSYVSTEAASLFGTAVGQTTEFVVGTVTDVALLQLGPAVIASKGQLSLQDLGWQTGFAMAFRSASFAAGFKSRLRDHYDKLRADYNAGVPASKRLPPLGDKAFNELFGRWIKGFTGQKAPLSVVPEVEPRTLAAASVPKSASAATSREPAPVREVEAITNEILALEKGKADPKALQQRIGSAGQIKVGYRSNGSTIEGTLLGVDDGALLVQSKTSGKTQRVPIADVESIGTAAVAEARIGRIAALVEKSSVLKGARDKLVQFYRKLRPAEASAARQFEEYVEGSVTQGTLSRQRRVRRALEACPL